MIGIKLRPAGCDALVDIRGTKCTRGPGENREHVIETMLDADVQGVIDFLAVERGCLRVAQKYISRRCHIKRIPCSYAGLLNPCAIGEISGWKYPHCLLPISASVCWVRS